MPTTVLQKAKQVLTKTAAPFPGIILDLEIRPEYSNVLFLVVYRANIEEFSEPKKDTIGAWLVAVRQKIENSIAYYGYQCILDGVDNVPS